MFRYVRDILVGFWSLIVGLGVTVRSLFARTITVQYPRHRLVMHANYRGHIQLRKHPDDEGVKCVACGTCARECPSGLILVQGQKENHVTDKKKATHYIIDFTKCSLCGLCVDACPVEALEFSMSYDMASYSRWDGVIDLVGRFEAGQAGGS